jgi:tRNA(Ile)-lysidine synthase
LADTISKDNDYLEGLSYEKSEIYCKRNQHKVIISKEAFKEKEAMLTRLVRNALNEVKGNLYNIEKVHIYDIIKLQDGSTGRKINLPGGIAAFNNYGNIELTRNETSSKNHKELEYTLYMDKINYIEELNISVSMRKVSSDERIDFKNSNYVKYFDAEKVNLEITLRTRKDGDRFTPFGMMGNKKLKHLFIDLKVPQEERDKIPLVCFGDEIAWIVGYRISDKFKIGKSTNYILEIKIENI